MNGEHERMCPKCDCMLYMMIMNDRQELIALECNMCGERMNVNPTIPRQE